MPCAGDRVREPVNLILIDSQEVDDTGTVVLDGRRARHICDVLGSKPGDRLRIGVIRGPIGVGEVVATGPQVVLRVDWDGQAHEPPSIELILAVPRPKVLGRVLQAAACMGVRRIDLINAWRVDKSYLHTRHLEKNALRHHLLLGCEQGGTSWLPDIAVHRLLMPFLRGPLTERMGRVSSLIAHPRATRMIESVVPAGQRAVLAAIGPEGGWIEREIASFVELGFAPVGLGERVWRVETAVVALLAQLELLRRL